MLAYVNDTEGAIPIGVGAGAVVVFRDALRGVAARSFTVYLKFQAKTRVEVLSPSTATLAFPGESGVPTGVGVPPPTEPPARVTLAELCYGARRGIGAIDQRAWRQAREDRFRGVARRQVGMSTMRMRRWIHRRRRRRRRRRIRRRHGRRGRARAFDAAAFSRTRTGARRVDLRRDDRRRRRRRAGSKPRFSPRCATAAHRWKSP